MLYTEKQETPNQTETQNNENRNPIYPNTTKNKTLTLEDKINVELIKKTMNEKKTILLLFARTGEQ